jgi:predicted nucleic acid-binding protein
VLVVDASVLATALGDDGPDGDIARARLRDQQMAAPELIDLEVVSMLRRQLAIEQLNSRRAELALDDLRDLPIQRAPQVPILARCWDLRHNLTIYDAVYVALAEAQEPRFSPLMPGWRGFRASGAPSRY